MQLKEKPDKVYEERKKILGSDPALLKLYKELVTTGMVLPEEFWSLRSNLIVSTQKQQGQFYIFNFYCQLVRQKISYQLDMRLCSQNRRMYSFILVFISFEFLSGYVLIVVIIISKKIV